MNINVTTISGHKSQVFCFVYEQVPITPITYKFDSILIECFLVIRYSSIHFGDLIIASRYAAILFMHTA